MRFVLHTPTIIDFLAFGGMWEVWALVFKEKMPFGWLRAKIYHRWPPDGHPYANLDDIPQRRSHRREGHGRAWRQRLVTQVPDVGYYVPVWTEVDGAPTVERGWVIDGQGRFITDADGELVRGRHPLAVKQGGYRILTGEGNAVATGSQCPHCSPIWVMLVALPLWCLWRNPVVVVGMVGLALMLGRLWAAKEA